tara:strand:- start:427 stop:576 length:150 start_codon:yes stop_codon:yes gene_type:complete
MTGFLAGVGHITDSEHINGGRPSTKMGSIALLVDSSDCEFEAEDAIPAL